MASIVFAILFYLATLLLVVGLLYRISTYARTPAPLKIPTTPAPTTTGGVVLRMTREVVFFESLFKSNLWIWGLGWLFHASLVLVVMRHLRYFTEPVWGWVAFIQPFGMYAGITMLLGLCGLWARRLFVERIRYISTPSDHLMLLLLIGIAASGLMMKFARAHRCDRGEGIFPRLDAFEYPDASCRSVVDGASVAGCVTPGRVPLQQIAARAGSLFLADTQPER